MQKTSPDFVMRWLPKRVLDQQSRDGVCVSDDERNPVPVPVVEFEERSEKPLTFIFYACFPGKTGGRKNGRIKGPEDPLFVILRPRAQNRAQKSRQNFDESFLQNAQLAGAISLSSDRTRFCAIYGWKSPEVLFPTVHQECDSDVCGESYAHFRNGVRCWKVIPETPQKSAT
ncbi:hypothetical protein Q3G72_033157 [Acer saccharum]|nr:hypothetical protein Q3G72_033157 [Acer saccharum]